MNTPKVSVVMSVYNGEVYLKSTIDSILNQTFHDFEFIVIDDGSTDGSSEILINYSDRRLKVIHQNNIGLTKSLNKAITFAKGEYIARQDADDVSLPNRLEKQVQILDSRPDIFLLTSWYTIIDRDGKEIIKRILPGEDKVKKLLMTDNLICHGSVMFKRKKFIEMGRYNEKFKHGQDKELWRKTLSLYDKLLIIPEFLYKYRVSTDNISLKKSERANNDESEKFTIRDKKSEFWLASMLLQQGEPRKARLILIKLIKNYFPGESKHWIYYLLTFCPIFIQTIFMWKIRIWVKILLNKFRVTL